MLFTTRTLNYSFNGATTNQLWKRNCRIPNDIFIPTLQWSHNKSVVETLTEDEFIEIQSNELQWSHNKSVVETELIDVIIKERRGASMEPQQISCGNDTEAYMYLVADDVLQWSHNKSVVETRCLAYQRMARTLLQWSHNKSVVETSHRIARLSPILTASMEPQQISCGNKRFIK